MFIPALECLTLDAGDGWTFLYVFLTTYLVSCCSCCYGKKFCSNLKSICFERKFMCVVCFIFIFTHFYHTDIVIVIIITSQHHQQNKYQLAGSLESNKESQVEVKRSFSFGFLLMRWGFVEVQRYFYSKINT